MARIIAEGSGKGFEADTPTATVIQPDAAGNVTLPPGVDATAIDLARQGQDLVLTTEDGQTFIVQNYFMLPQMPAIVSEGGSALSPALVQSFLKTAGDVQVAANEQTNDASPVGEVTEVSGNATVTHADGTKSAISTGTQIFEGDIIETDAKGAVNIKFADDSTFAVSENGRLAVDDFSFNPADQSGTTGLSVLRGVFMFTSGLIGRENPDAVHLETPVGSIGIRGTIIGGQILENGKSQISVLEGAIVVRNGAGEQILSNQFETVQLTGFNSPISNIGQLDAGQMSQSYGAVRSVSQNLFTSIDDTARDSKPQQGAQPENKGEAQPQTEGEPQSQNQPAGDAAAPAQAAGEAPAQQGAAAATGTTVFQTLSTGSNLDHGTTTTPAATAQPTTQTNTTTTVTTTAPAPVTPVQVVVAEPAPLAPGKASFLSGGSTPEETSAGVIVGTVGVAEAHTYPLLYSITGGDGRYTIDARTGVVTQQTYAGDYDAGVRQHDLTVRATRTDTGQFTETKLSVAVTAVDEKPNFDNTAFSVNEGQSTTLTHAMVGATDPEGGALTYVVSMLNKGVVEVFDGSQWLAATTFTSTQLASDKVRFVHDGSEPGAGTPASFNLVANDAAGLHTRTQTISITVAPVNDAPVNAVSATTFTEGQDTLLTGSLLKWTDSDNEAHQIVYTLQSSSHGNVQLEVAGVWSNIANNATFTQEDINDGHIRFLHNGDEASTAGFTYSVTDGIAAAQTATYSMNVTQVNDPASAGLPSSAPIAERPVGTETIITALSIEDGETVAANPNYVFVVQRQDASTWVTDNRFEVKNIAGTWTLVAKATTTLDYETMNAMTLRVQLTDGSNPATLTNAMVLSITDVNEAATGFTFNDGGKFSASYDTVLTGNQPTAGMGGIIARISVDDPDTQAGYIPTAANYQVTNVTGGYNASEFKIETVTINGEATAVLRYNNTITPNFANATGFSITVKLDADMDGNFNGEKDIEKVITVWGRNEVVSIIALDEFNYAQNTLVMRNFDTTAGNDIATAMASQSKIAITYNENIADVGYITNIPAGSGAIDMASRDLNGDGYGEMIIGVDGANGGVGSVGIIIGGRTSHANIDYNASDVLHLTPQGTSDVGFGTAVASLGDINGDGFGDFIVGAPRTDTNNTSAGNDQGAVYLYFGSKIMSEASLNASVTTIKSSVVGDLFGATVSSAGDFNGDGKADFMVRTAADDNGEGAIRLFFGSNTISGANLDASALNTVGGFSGATIRYHPGTNDGLIVGETISRAGDINGDGIDDIAIDVAKDLGGGKFDHTIYVLYGNINPQTEYNLSSLTPTQGMQIHLMEPTGRTLDITPAGDQNHDGYDDLFIGDPNAPSAGEGMVGAITVYGGTYDLKTIVATPVQLAASNNAYYTGGAAATTLRNNGHIGLTFKAGGGDDVFEITTVSAVKKFYGGGGFDTLRLVASADETGTGVQDNITLTGKANLFQSVEQISFADNSKQDHLVLDIADVLQLIKSSDNNALRISAGENSSGLSVDLYDSGTLITSLASLAAGLKFTNNNDGVAGADTREIGGIMYNVYTNVQTHGELLIDSRITNASSLIS